MNWHYTSNGFRDDFQEISWSILYLYKKMFEMIFKIPGNYLTHLHSVLKTNGLKSKERSGLNFYLNFFFCSFLWNTHLNAQFGLNSTTMWNIFMESNIYVIHYCYMCWLNMSIFVYTYRESFRWFLGGGGLETLILQRLGEITRIFFSDFCLCNCIYIL